MFWRGRSSFIVDIVVAGWLGRTRRKLLSMCMREEQRVDERWLEDGFSQMTAGKSWRQCDDKMESSKYAAAGPRLD